METVSQKRKIALVVQRYGLEVNGGAEMLARTMAEHLKDRYDIEVLTSKAVDYVTWKDEYTADEEVINACKNANIYDYIMSLPNKFETTIWERGVKLSGGQKQRISIARVFLKNPPILILDEATSALDNTTELLIQEALNKLSEGRTTIIVAHRLSTIKNATRIMLINDGKIKECGSHNELMALNKEYARLYNLQFSNKIFN